MYVYILHTYAANFVYVNSCKTTKSFLIQISTNATQTMEDVLTSVPIHKDHECVAVELDSPWLVMEETVKVAHTTR